LKQQQKLSQKCKTSNNLLLWKLFKKNKDQCMSNEAVLHTHATTEHHDAHGDHHGEHHHHETFISKYVFSQDHKMIAKQFLITGMVWAVLGGLMSVLFRLQLGYPDSTFPWLEDILGKWAAGGKITPAAYYALVTTHGTVLVFFVLTAGLSGTFANFLIPLQVGARDMASPFMNMLSYWFFFTASIVMLSSL
jgi:cytochrome c oxidase subunit I